MSIQKKEEKNKGTEYEIVLIDGDDTPKKTDPHVVILVVLLFCFLGLSSFALGRLSVTKDKQKSLVIETVPPEFFSAPSEGADTSAENLTTSAVNLQSGSTAEASGFLVGSKNSTKYHFPWCSGAKRIKQENLISFSSYEEARAAGYTPAGNCEGLE